MAVREEVFSLEKRLADFGCWQKILSYRFGAWKLYRITSRSTLFDWLGIFINERSNVGFGSSLFLESEFTHQEEEDFLSHYESEQTPVSREKITIYKILQDAIWSLWTVYKEEQGADFGDYGVNRYQRAVKGLSYYGGSDEK